MERDVTVQQEGNISREQHLRQLSERTNDDGTVNVKLTDWTQPEDPKNPDCTATVRFNVVGETYETEVDYPVAGEDLATNEFNRLLHAADLSMDMPDFDHASEVRARRSDDGEWELVLPERADSSVIRSFADRIPKSDVENPNHPVSITWSIVLAIFLPATILILIAMFDDEKFGLQEASIAIMFGLGSVLWTGALLFLLFLLL